MKTLTAVQVLWITVVAGTLGCKAQPSEELTRLKEENEALKAKIAQLEQPATEEVKPESNGALPEALDSLYPPSSEAPVFLMQMHEMAMSMDAMFADLLDQDVENARKGFDAFKTAYQKASTLVPDWTDRFPAEPMDGLGTAIQSGDQDQVMGAMQALGGVCKDCHNQHMTAVQFKYHWRDITQLTVPDPVSKSEMPFTQFKHAMSSNFAGIGANLQQGQPAEAKKQYQAFAARFDALSEACGECHDTERHYYVSKDVKAAVKKLGQMMNKPPKDPAAFVNLAQEIGQKSCAGCHRVHVPAMLAKANAGGSAPE